MTKADEWVLAGICTMIAVLSLAIVYGLIVLAVTETLGLLIFLAGAGVFLGLTWLVHRLLLPFLKRITY